MAEGDPQLAAKLLAAFSDPAPTEEGNTALPATSDPEPHHLSNTNTHAAETKDQPTEQATQSQEPRVLNPEPPQALLPAIPTPLPEPMTQATEPLSQTSEPQTEPQVPATEAHFPSEPPSQTPNPPVEPTEPHPKLEPQPEALDKDFEPQKSVPQASEPVVSPLESQTYVPESSEPPLIPPPPPSPVKRQRSPEKDGHTAGKRIKTDHDSFDHHPIDFSAANWDISAMIQNALGSFDEQLHHTDRLEHPGPLEQPHGEPHNDTKQEPAPDPVPHASPVVKKIDQKHMKFSSNPYYMMRTMSLASLGSLAIQILLALSQQSREETLALISDQESEYRKAYDILKNALDAARRIFSESSPLLSPDELEISDSEDRETLRVSNLAAISTSAIAGDDSLMVDGHDQFFSIFIQDEGEFTKDLSELYMSIKTQALISSLTSATNPSERSDVLDRFFPPDFDDQLKQRHGDTTFSSGREDLVAEVGRKRQEFLEAILDDERRRRLPVDHPMTGFLDSLVVYLQDHLAVIIDYAEKYGINIPASEESIINEPLGGGHAPEDHDELSALLQSATSKLLEELPGLGDLGHASGTGDSLSDSLGLGKLIQESLQNQGAAKDDISGVSAGDGSGLFESGGLASLIAAKLNNGFDNVPNHPQAYGNGQGQLSGLGQPATTAPSPYLAQYNQLAQAPYYAYNNQAAAPPPPPPADGEQLPPNQTLPTSQLYERARQAAVAKSNNAARREGIHSTRRAWTPEEERALMTGLDMVKGPHWSQILSLFGPNGSISDILKDRTQVQLKDKARNLKLFFLKTNSEMPYYLQCVTGELKTRAPGQAARKEAEEKARQNSEDEQARIAGIMTLAGGLQHNHATVNNQQGDQPSQANQVSNLHQIQASNSFSNGHIQTPSQASPAQARTTLRPTTPNPVGQNGGLAAIAPNMNTTMAHSVTPQPAGTPTPMTPTPSINSSMIPLAPRLAGNMASATPTPTMPHVAIAPAPAPPTSPAVKSEPQDHLPQLQPKPEPQPGQASQQPPRFGQQQEQQREQQQQQQQQQPTTPHHQTAQQQQPQQVQQPQQLPSPQQAQQPQQMQQTQQSPPSQPPRVQVTLSPVAPTTPAPAPVSTPVPAPPFAQPYTQTATAIARTQDIQTSIVTNQQTHHDESQNGGLSRHFEHQNQPQSQSAHHESHVTAHERGGIVGHHEQHQENDHHDNTDITTLLQTLQAATASI